MNPYEFTRMEWWRNRNRDGLGHVFVGFCDNGDKYLTFNNNLEEDGIVPVFSPICKVGGKNGHTEEAYKYYRHKFDTLDGYTIQAVTSCYYRDSYQIDKSFKFDV